MLELVKGKTDIIFIQSILFRNEPPDPVAELRKTEKFFDENGKDPIEPPPHGDVELSYVRSRYGKQLVLFGNLEVSDIENLPTEQFAKKVTEALKQGTLGEGREFVLMPTACPLVVFCLL